MTNRGWFPRVATLMLVAGACLAAMPADAQLFGDRYPFDQRPRRQQQQERFFPFFGEREREYQRPARPDYVRPSPPVDPTKAPAARKQDKPPTNTVVVVGDSLGDWLAYGLDETLGDASETGVVRKIRASSGLVRYEPRSDGPEWSQAVKDILAQDKPSAIIVMLGLHDRQSIREQASARPAPRSHVITTVQTNPDQSGQSPEPNAVEPPRPGAPATYEFRTDKWAETYAKRVDEMIAALKAKGVPVLWVGLPSIRSARSNSDITYLNDIYRMRSEKAGIVYVDVWDGFVDESGRFAQQGPDFDGQIRRLRAGDGTHFTKAGAIKLAHYVQRELRRVLSRPAAPVARTTPETVPAVLGRPAGSAARPTAGPVVPLNAAGKDDELLGSGRPANVEPAIDGTAIRVLTRGEPLAAPAGRADDFVWPRRGFNANIEPSPEPVAQTPTKPATKAGAGRGDDKKKADPKVQPRRSPRAEVNGRPPAPVGTAAVR